METMKAIHGPANMEFVKSLGAAYVEQGHKKGNVAVTVNETICTPLQPGKF